MSKKVMLSAVQPTNKLHLGNYLGAIRNWVTLQTQYDCVFFAVDLHALTVRQDPKELRENTYRTIATYLAAGLDPKACTFFAQSHVPEHAELAWVLTCFTGMGELARMTQFKDKSGSKGDSVGSGLFTYPALMAADILLYKANLVPVGQDQKQHLELTRDLAERLNTFLGEPIFPIPEVYIAPTASRVMSLLNPEAKMSKSDENGQSAIFMSDTDDEIRKKFKRAVTDSLPAVAEKDISPGVQNLLQIQSALKGVKTEEIHKAYVGRQYGYLKLETAEIVVDALRPIREKITALMNDKTELDRLISEGGERARARAGKTISQVYDKLGLLPRFGS